MRTLDLKAQWLSGLEKHIVVDYHPLNVILRPVLDTPFELAFSINLSVQELLWLLEGTKEALHDQVIYFERLLELKKRSIESDDLLRKQIKAGTLPEE